MTDEPRHLETELVHAGVDRAKFDGAGVTPIIRSTVFESREGAGYHDISYGRLSNLANQKEAAAAIARAEGAGAGLVTSSGMSAITTSLFAILAGGGHLLAQHPLYGATQQFLSSELPKLGASVTFIDIRDVDNWSRHVQPHTSAVYVESINNPLLEVADHGRIAAFAKQHGLVSIIDNTFASPVNFRPIQLGFDLVLHSATKYLNGHSDVCAGAVVGDPDRIQQVKSWLDILGGAADPEACYLLRRGLKTLSLRVQRQNENALHLARFLESSPGVERVLYPGLSSHPDHELARRYFSGYGGMLACVLRGGAERAHAFASSLQVAIHSASLGGAETLVTLPAKTSHAGLSDEERRRAGISDALIRISAGIEHVDDLRADFQQALRLSARD